MVRGVAERLRRRLREAGSVWNATPAECTATYPCDAYLEKPWRGLLRAIDVDAPAAVVFRWDCQLKVAPYSYNPLGNTRRRSPGRLTPGAGDLAVGQPFLVFAITDFEPGHHISGTSRASFDRIYGPLAITYAVRARSEHTSRIVVKLNGATASRWRRARMAALAVGDLIMMRKQLLTLKAHAEAGKQGGGIVDVAVR